MIYLVGASTELQRVRHIASIVERTGLRLTYRWFDDVAAAGVGSEFWLSQPEKRATAEKCLAAIDAAELVWFLWPTTRSTGCYVEYGYAWSRRFERLPIVVSGLTVSSTLWPALCEPEHVQTDDDRALDIVVRLVREGRV